MNILATLPLLFHSAIVATAGEISETSISISLISSQVQNSSVTIVFDRYWSVSHRCSIEIFFATADNIEE